MKLEDVIEIDPDQLIEEDNKPIEIKPEQLIVEEKESKSSAPFCVA